MLPAFCEALTTSGCAAAGNTLGSLRHSKWPVTIRQAREAQVRDMHQGSRCTRFHSSTLNRHDWWSVALSCCHSRHLKRYCICPTGAHVSFLSEAVCVTSEGQCKLSCSDKLMLLRAGLCSKVFLCPAASSWQQHRRKCSCSSTSSAALKQHCFIATEEAATRYLSARLALDLRAGDCYCLTGKVGCGKSAFR